MAPIFSLIQVKPSANFSSICCFIKASSPIQTKPLIVIASFPLVKSEGNNSNGVSACKDKNAISTPNCIEGNSSNSFHKLSFPK